MQQRVCNTRFLRELLVSEEKAAELKKEAMHLPSWDLTQRQVWDIELLLTRNNRNNTFLCIALRICVSFL